MAADTARAQTLTVLHSFTGGGDGATPLAGLVMDGAGNLYGTASAGGAGHGTVFKLANHGSSWVFLPLYSFQGSNDGAVPLAVLTIGPDGSLFGTTESGGIPGDCDGLGCGTVFNLRPPPTRPSSVIAPWDETVLFRFSQAMSLGFYPYSEVTFDAAGNLYGTVADTDSPQSRVERAPSGNCANCGSVYELTRSGNNWTETLLYSFPGSDVGEAPLGGVIFDQAGNLYGTASGGGHCGYGIVFELTPGQSGWTEQTIQAICGGLGGANPSSTLLLSSGTLYGGTPGEPLGFGDVPGSVFTLTSSGGEWHYTSLHTFGFYGIGPAGALALDSAGNLYGTTAIGGITAGVCAPSGCGTVWELSPSGGGWSYTELYDFTGGADGAAPHSRVTLDASGHLYGTTSAAGASGFGTVWELTP
ncbi:MAG TPA: choice-of-anchor tandem repeat GloVer-containing protein [Candidatus Bathyarchaeia archaeon]|nr:choice-of-anchor tandem repeat GloVer-containing protein [Candidatus Bathyarchaeia archaeon]